MTQTAKNYADALYELARDAGLDERVMQELTGVNALFAANPDYVRLLSASNVRREEQLAALDEAFSGRVHTYVCSFLKLLCERHHIRELPNCARRFRQRFNADHGILEASAVTARPLTDAQREKLTARLAGLTGKRVDLENRVDPTVLGGIRLEYEGMELDGTVRARLDGLKKTLSDTVL